MEVRVQRVLERLELVDFFQVSSQHILEFVNILNLLLSFQIISKDLSEPVRSHKDLDKDAAPYYKKAVKFYDSIAKQLVAQGHVLDLFASALDQVLMCRYFFILLDAQTLILFFIYECVVFFRYA